MTPNGVELDAAWGPFAQAPWLTPFFTSATFAIWQSPLVPTSAQPETLPTQSTLS